MLSGGLQATRIKDQRFSFIFPYLGFTSFHHTFLLWRPKKPGWVKRSYFLFPCRPCGERKDFFIFNIDFIFICASWAFYSFILPRVYEAVRSFCCCCFHERGFCICICDGYIHLQAVWPWLGVQIAGLGWNASVGNQVLRESNPWPWSHSHYAMSNSTNCSLFSRLDQQQDLKILNSIPKMVTLIGAIRRHQKSLLKQF